jgi:hypothetical protein
LLNCGRSELAKCCGNTVLDSTVGSGVNDARAPRHLLGLGIVLEVDGTAFDIDDKERSRLHRLGVFFVRRHPFCR